MTICHHCHRHVLHLSYPHHPDCFHFIHYRYSIYIYIFNFISCTIKLGQVARLKASICCTLWCACFLWPHPKAGIGDCNLLEHLFLGAFSMPHHPHAQNLCKCNCSNTFIIIHIHLWLQKCRQLGSWCSSSFQLQPPGSLGVESLDLSMVQGTTDRRGQGCSWTGCIRISSWEGRLHMRDVLCPSKFVDCICHGGYPHLWVLRSCSGIPNCSYVGCNFRTTIEQKRPGATVHSPFLQDVYSCSLFRSGQTSILISHIHRIIHNVLMFVLCTAKQIWDLLIQLAFLKCRAAKTLRLDCVSQLQCRKASVQVNLGQPMVI